MDTNGLFFNSHFISEEILIKIIDFIIPTKLDILNCRAVCKKWNSIVLDLWQKKIKMKMKTNPSYTPLTEQQYSEIPWFISYLILAYDPFEKNLFGNYSQEALDNYDSELSHKSFLLFQWMTSTVWDWRLIKTEKTKDQLPKSDDFKETGYCYFIPKFHEQVFGDELDPRICINVAKIDGIIDLEHYGLSNFVMNELKPEITFSLWIYTHRGRGAIVVRGKGSNTLAERIPFYKRNDSPRGRPLVSRLTEWNSVFKSNEEMAIVRVSSKPRPNWKKVEMKIKNYSAGIRFILLYISIYEYDCDPQENMVCRIAGLMLKASPPNLICVNWAVLTDSDYWRTRLKFKYPKRHSAIDKCDWLQKDCPWFVFRDLYYRYPFVDDSVSFNVKRKFLKSLYRTCLEFRGFSAVMMDYIRPMITVNIKYLNRKDLEDFYRLSSQIALTNSERFIKASSKLFILKDSQNEDNYKIQMYINDYEPRGRFVELDFPSFSSSHPSCVETEIILSLPHTRKVPESPEEEMEANGIFFDSHFIPKEILIHITDFIIPEKIYILNCRAVCKIWRSVVHYLWQKNLKMKMEKSLFYSTLTTERCLEIPWFLAYIITAYDPFERNLFGKYTYQEETDKPVSYRSDIDLVEWVTNSHCQWQWEASTEEEDLFPESEDFEDSGYYLLRPTLKFMDAEINSMNMAFLDEMIDLRKLGLSQFVLDELKPEITISLWVIPLSGEGVFGITARNYDDREGLIHFPTYARYDPLLGRKPITFFDHTFSSYGRGKVNENEKEDCAELSFRLYPHWQKLEIKLKDYSAGLRYIRLFFFACDSQEEEKLDCLVSGVILKVSPPNLFCVNWALLTDNDYWRTKLKFKNPELHSTIDECNWLPQDGCPWMVLNDLVHRDPFLGKSCVFIFEGTSTEKRINLHDHDFSAAIMNFVRPLITVNVKYLKHKDLKYFHKFNAEISLLNCANKLIRKSSRWFLIKDDEDEDEDYYKVQMKIANYEPEVRYISLFFPSYVLFFDPAKSPVEIEVHLTFPCTRRTEQEGEPLTLGTE